MANERTDQNGTDNIHGQFCETNGSPIIGSDMGSLHDEEKPGGQPLPSAGRTGGSIVSAVALVQDHEGFSSQGTF